MMDDRNDQTEIVPLEGFRLTGWHVLAGLLSFFALVLLANGVMIYNAATTWTGLEADRATAHGLDWNAELDRARAQKQRNWQVDFTAAPTGDIAVIYHEGTGQLAGVAAVEVHYRHPINATLDQKISAIPGYQPGQWRASPDVALVPGQWDIALTARDATGQIVHQRVERLRF